jgi:hypothetical protein
MFLSFCFGDSTAQGCNNLFADLKNGTINKVKPTASQQKVKAALPCFTGDSEEGGDFNCGGGVFFLKHGFFFYTGKDYIEIRENYKGKLSIPVLGLTKDMAIAKLKMGKVIRTETVNEEEVIFFKTIYGCLWLKLVEGKVVNVVISSKQVSDAELCL